MAAPQQDLGTFAAGEVPYPLEHTFKDSDGVVIDLTGFNTWVAFEGDITLAGSGAVAIDGDPTTGIVSYTWVYDDMGLAGKEEFLIWVEDNTNQLASDKFKYTVYDGPGTTPVAP